MANALPSTFCIIPWMHRHVDEQGHHRLCCIGDGEANFLKSTSGQKLHVSDNHSDNDILNSPVAKATRVAMMRNQWPAACIRCEQAEDASGESGRHHLNKRFDHGTAEDLLARTAPDGTLENVIVRYADIRLGNVCNLTCRMCTPVASRLWAPMFNQTQPEGYRIGESELVVLGQNNWVKKDPVNGLLQECLPYLEALHVAGGEPLIVPELVDALELCIASGRAGEIDLSFNTNTTVLPDKVTRLWPHFKSVAILASIDGFGQVNDYIRRPSKWADIDRNLHILDENFEAWKLKWITLSCTTQISNILTLDKLFAYLREQKFQHVTAIPQLVPLFYPNYLSIQALPAKAKDKARKMLQDEIARAEALNDPELTGSINTVRSTLAFMDDADTTRDLPDFLEFTEKSDTVFKDSWKAATPELEKEIRAYFRQPRQVLNKLTERLRA